MSSDQISEKLRELYPYYQRVKEALIFAESFDPKKRIYLAPFNQLRSALDHTFRCFSDNPDIEYNTGEIKEHLIRAGNDTFEILCTNISLEITKLVSKFNMDTLCKGFPDYYPTHKPILIKIQKELAEIRAHKKNGKPGDINSFEEYFTQFEKLLVIYEDTNSRIPSLCEIRKKMRWKFFWQYFIPFLSALTVAFLGFLLYQHYK